MLAPRMTARSFLAASAALLALALAPVEGGSFVSPRAALAEAKLAEDIGVGASLVAVTDVELDRAIIRAGSKVSVVGRKARAGRVLLDVALADGHVVRAVPLARLRAAFRVA